VGSEETKKKIRKTQMKVLTFNQKGEKQVSLGNKTNQDET